MIQKLLSLTLILACSFATLSAYAQDTPGKLQYQGTVVVPKGAKAAAYVVTFGIYNFATSGAPVWQETQTVQADANGNFTVMIGAVTPLTPSLLTWGTTSWLGVTQTGQPQQTPRTLLSTVPYALKASNALDSNKLEGHSYLDVST